MKKVLLAVAMLAVAVTAGAQNPNQLLSSIEKAKAAHLFPRNRYRKAVFHLLSSTMSCVICISTTVQEYWMP